MTTVDLTAEIDATLIDQGHPAECVQWTCSEHRRHCTHLGTTHDQHACYWCVRDRMVT